MSENTTPANPSPAGPPASDAPTRPPFNEISVLFPLLSLYTAGYLALMIADFALKTGFELPEGILPVYIALLGAYAADKEIRRWLVKPEPPRKGSLFVYLWLLFFLAVYIIRSFRPEYTLPANLGAVCLQVLGIFFGSRASKYVWEGREKSDADAGPARERLILDWVAEKGQVTRKDVADRLGVSERTANRLLQDLESRNLLRRQGEARGIHYVLP